MNREILFRAKCFGNWRYGSYVHFDKKPTNSRCNINYKDFIITNEDDGEHYYPITDLSSIGQYTGLKDKNGKEIYEGDIVALIETDKTASVAWSEEFATFALQFDFADKAGVFPLGTWEQMTVIGNVHTNPELIK